MTLPTDREIMEAVLKDQGVSQGDSEPTDEPLPKDATDLAEDEPSDETPKDPETEPKTEPSDENKSAERLRFLNKQAQKSLQRLTAKERDIQVKSQEIKQAEADLQKFRKLEQAAKTGNWRAVLDTLGTKFDDVQNAFIEGDGGEQNAALAELKSIIEQQNEKLARLEEERENERKERFDIEQRQAVQQYVSVNSAKYPVVARFNDVDTVVEVFRELQARSDDDADANALLDNALGLVEDFRKNELIQAKQVHDSIFADTAPSALKPDAPRVKPTTLSRSVKRDTPPPVTSNQRQSIRDNDMSAAEWLRSQAQRR